MNPASVSSRSLMFRRIIMRLSSVIGLLSRMLMSPPRTAAATRIAAEEIGMPPVPSYCENSLSSPDG